MFKYLWVCVFLGSVIMANERVTYTFEGVKDPRLSAQFSVRYIASSDSKACTNLRLVTGTKRPAMADKVYEIPDGNYSITMPISFGADSSKCGYQFRRIELKVRRKNDDELYSSHVLLDTETKSRPIYYGRWGGSGGQRSIEMPSSLETNKKYFRIAQETRFLCATKWYEHDEGTSFFCRMQLGDGKGDNRFIPLNDAQTIVTHSHLGVDEVKNETLRLDITVEEKRCLRVSRQGKKEQDIFREVPKHWWSWMKIWN